MRSTITIKGYFSAKNSFTAEVFFKNRSKVKKWSEKVKSNTKGEVTRV